MDTVLVAGATGLVGEAAMTAFAAAGWRVIATSRRTPDPMPPGDVRHIAVDLTDAQACLAAFEGISDVTHVVYAALYEKPGLLAGWREVDQMETNLSMLRNLMTPLTQAARGLQHVTLLQGTKAYGAHLKQPPLPARERTPRDDHANFYWLQEDWLRARAAQFDFAWTIFRPQIVVGAAWGAAMNPLLAIGAWAALRREQGLPLAYPGGSAHVMELVDPRLLGDAFLWAARSPAAGNNTFNITNGDVFAWPEVWPAIADALGMPLGPPEPTRIAPLLAASGEAWAALAARHDLRPIPLPALLGESHHYADALLRPGVEAVTLPILVSTIKLRQAGFPGCYDSEDTLRHWLGVMAERRLLPR